MAFVDDYRLILFDLDGTLADTHRLIFDSFNFVLRKYKSIEMTPLEILSYFGPPEEICIKNMLGNENYESVWHDFISYYTDHLEETTIFAGVRELLEFLKSSGKHIGVFTAKGATTADLTLRHHRIKSFFEVIVTGTEVRNHKPDPEGIMIALAKLGLPAAETLVVGDSPSDFKAAASAGTGFIAVTYDSISRNRFDNISCTKAATVHELSKLLSEDGA